MIRPEDEFLTSRQVMSWRMGRAGSAAARAVIVLGTVTAIGYRLFTLPGSFFTRPTVTWGHHTAGPEVQPMVWRGTSYWQWILSSWPASVLAVAAGIIAISAMVVPRRHRHARATAEDRPEGAVLRFWLM